jgi:cardiolipin synthase (CMP-forming)
MKYSPHIPNAISIFRLLLVLPITVAIVENEYFVGFLLFSIAGISDGLDGYIARKYDWVTAFGEIMDPLADKLLLLATAATLGLLGHIPVMVFFLMIAKDLAVIGGVLAYTVLAGFPELRPITVGKVTTVLQILLIGYVLITLVADLPFVAMLTPILVWLVALFTILDGSTYLWLWTGKLARDPRWLQAVTPT